MDFQGALFLKGKKSELLPSWKMFFPNWRIKICKFLAEVYTCQLSQMERCFQGIVEGNCFLFNRIGVNLVSKHYLCGRQDRKDSND